MNEIYERLEPLVRQKPWSVSLGKGSSIQFEFGDPLPPDEDGDISGEWHLRVCDAMWRLETRTEVLAASGDQERDKLEAAVKRMEHKTLLSITVFPPAWETEITFAEGLILRLFPVRTKDYDHWMLFTPDRKVLTIGPGSSWSYDDELVDSG